jgi:hypothetical protein
VALRGFKIPSPPGCGNFLKRDVRKGLTWLTSFKNLEGKTKRWIQCLQEYNFSSEHHQGQKHNADALS